MTEALLGPPLTEISTQFARQAQAQQQRIFLVGGIVRDMLLGRVAQDFDYLLEGDAPVFVQRIYQDWEQLFPGFPVPRAPLIYERYRTVKLPFPAEIAPGVDTIEFASTRSETYPIPGGRPEVVAADLRSDLARRDFSINAMAIELSPDSALTICDFHDGQKDLAAGVLNILHSDSFRDDPARLLRALRFAARFQFSLGEHTAPRFDEAVAGRFLQTLPKQRLLDEFRKLLSEKNPAAVLRLLEERNMLTQIHPLLQLNANAIAELALRSEWQARFRLLFSQLNDGEFDEVLTFFAVPRKEKQRFLN